MVAPGKRVKLSSLIPVARCISARRRHREGYGRGCCGNQPAAGRPLRGGQAGAARGAAGHRHGRQGRHDPRCLQRDRPARRVAPQPSEAPSEEELSHDFLWRVHPPFRAAARSASSTARITRTCSSSRCRKLVPADEIEARYEEINAFEKNSPKTAQRYSSSCCTSQRTNSASACRSGSTIPQAVEVQSRRS